MEPSIAQITVSRVVREKNTNEDRQTETQIKEAEETRTDMVVLTAEQVKQEVVTVEKNPYQKWIVWVIGVVVLIIGVRLYSLLRSA